MLSLDGHASPSAGAIIQNKYCIEQRVGYGTFASVFQATCLGNRARVAVKLLKRGLESDMKAEADILRCVREHDPELQEGVVGLVDETFLWHGHPTLVLPLKGKSLRHSILPLTPRSIGRLTIDVARSLNFLHNELHVVHTDLKPENVVREILSNSGRGKAAREWCICDLGGASFDNGCLEFDTITTRAYRAPEVVMRRGWSAPADIWSLGCILFEAARGKPLVTAKTDSEHIQQIQQRCGMMNGSCPSIRSELAKFDPIFVDLVLRMLCVDPSQRIDARGILIHAFVASALAHADDFSAPRPCAVSPMPQESFSSPASGGAITPSVSSQSCVSLSELSQVAPTPDPIPQLPLAVSVNAVVATPVAAQRPIAFAPIRSNLSRCSLSALSMGCTSHP